MSTTNSTTPEFGIFYDYNSETGEVTLKDYYSADTSEVNNGVYQDIAEVVAGEVIGSIETFIDKVIEKSSSDKAVVEMGKVWVAKPIAFLGFSLDYLSDLKEQREQYGDNALKDAASALAQSYIGYYATTVAASVAIPASAGLFTTLVVGAAVGVIVDSAYEAKFFDDGITSVKDKIGSFIENFDLTSTTDKLYTLAEEGTDVVLTDIQSTLSTLVSSATTLNSTTSSFLTSLTQAEATQPVYRRDPLTLDLDGDGIDLVSLSNSSTFFDLDNDGLREQVGWVGADDGLLVYDSNNNSLVDNVTELFGYENEDGTEVSGTEELRTYDLGGNAGFETDADGNIITDSSGNAVYVGAADGVIDSNDAIFSNLQVWQDADQDGLTDSGELKYLSDLNISSINLNDTTASNQNVNGNVILSTGSYNTETTTETTSTITNEDGTTSEVTSTTTTTNSNQFANLNLAINQTNSSSYEYTDSDGNTVSYDLNLETLTLPFSRGYGNSTAWHIAMSEDDTLSVQVL